MVKPSDKNFQLAQSKINYIYGIRAYNDNQMAQANVYLSKVIPGDEYYGESQLLLEKIAGAAGLLATEGVVHPR